MKFCDINIRDPFVVLHEGKYYMYGTRGATCWGGAKGVDVYVSDDLETWSDPIEVFSAPAGYFHNMWAPEVHLYKGNFYMFMTLKPGANHPDPERKMGTYILRADAPDGKFTLHSERAITPSDWNCLDGTLYVENGKPYMVFCHEWTQVHDGEICAIPMKDDLTAADGEAVLLFTASQPKWNTGLGNDGVNFVTDGPFFYRTSQNRLVMIWSSVVGENYCEAMAYSSDNTLMGKWTNDERLLFEKDGGHGMIFRDNDGKLLFICHQPNDTPNERPVLFELAEENDSFRVK